MAHIQDLLVEERPTTSANTSPISCVHHRMNTSQEENYSIGGMLRETCDDHSLSCIKQECDGISTRPTQFVLLRSCISPTTGSMVVAVGTTDK